MNILYTGICGAFLLHILELLGSNTGQEIGYPGFNYAIVWSYTVMVLESVVKWIKNRKLWVKSMNCLLVSHVSCICVINYIKCIWFIFNDKCTFHTLISSQFFRMCNTFQVCELKKQIRESSSLSTAQHTLHQLVFQKLAVAHHSALQGLQVIETEVELQIIIVKQLHNMMIRFKCKSHKYFEPWNVLTYVT